MKPLKPKEPQLLGFDISDLGEHGPEMQKRIQVLAAADLDFVVYRLARDTGISIEGAREGRLEWLQYVVLTMLSNDPIAPISRRADDFWHAFLLFTKQYAEFCERHLGHFLHHNPLSANDPLATDSASRTRKLVNRYLK